MHCAGVKGNGEAVLLFSNPKSVTSVTIGFVSKKSCWVLCARIPNFSAFPN